MTNPDEVAGSMPQLLSTVLAALREGENGLSPLVRLCQACVSLLPVDGASVSVMLGTRHRQSLYASDSIVQHLEDVQFSLGEGPCFEALETGRPVLVPDLAEQANLAWPVFAAEVRGEDVGAIFAFPLRRGAARFGAMDMYRRTPGWMSKTEVATALQIADIATSALLAASATGPDGRITEAWLTELSQDRAAVHQATGIVIAEFAVPAEEALARLRGYAFAAGRSVQDVADELVTGRLHPRVIDE